MKTEGTEETEKHAEIMPAPAAGEASEAAEEAETDKNREETGKVQDQKLYFPVFRFTGNFSRTQEMIDSKNENVIIYDIE